MPLPLEALEVGGAFGMRLLEIPLANSEMKISALRSVGDCLKKVLTPTGQNVSPQRDALGAHIAPLQGDDFLSSLLRSEESRN